MREEVGYRAAQHLKIKILAPQVFEKSRQYSHCSAQKWQSKQETGNWKEIGIGGVGEKNWIPISDSYVFLKSVSTETRKEMCILIFKKENKVCYTYLGKHNHIHCHKLRISVMFFL